MKRQRSSLGPPRDMWSDACELLEQADRIRRSFFVPGRTSAGVAAWEPPVDIYETARDVRVVVALPGVTRTDLEVDLQGDMLVISGRRTLPPGLRHATLHRLEIPHGRFERRIRLAASHLGLGEVSLVDGCLQLILEKHPRPIRFTHLTRRMTSVLPPALNHANSICQ